VLPRFSRFAVLVVGLVACAAPPVSWQRN
jgi:hypothetical protein